LCYILNYNTKVKAGKTAEEYILPVKKKQITDKKERLVLKASLLFNLLISGLANS
jgi:hypothetical protein